jgi:hypothetical protein
LQTRNFFMCATNAAVFFAWRGRPSADADHDGGEAFRTKATDARSGEHLRQGALDSTGLDNA